MYQIFVRLDFLLDESLSIQQMDENIHPPISVGHLFESFFTSHLETLLDEIVSTFLMNSVHHTP